MQCMAVQQCMACSVGQCNNAGHAGQRCIVQCFAMRIQSVATGVMQLIQFTPMSVLVVWWASTITIQCSNVLLLFRADKSPKRALADDEDDQRRARKEKLIAEMTAIRFHTDFERFKIVGKGSFGVVYRCVETQSNVTFAVKRSIVPVTLRDYDLNEVSIFKLIGPHPNIVRYISSWIETDSLFVQMEFCNGGSLGFDPGEAESRATSHDQLRPWNPPCSDQLRTVPHPLLRSGTPRHQARQHPCSPPNNNRSPQRFQSCRPAMSRWHCLQAR